MAIMEAVGIGKQFGGLYANRDINCRFEEGQITSIIGPNGAGKTTFFNILSGFYKPSSGNIFYEGKEITGWPIHKIARLGITRSFQILNIFNDITPAENIRLAIQFQKKNGFNWFKPAMGYQDTNRETTEVLREIGLSDVMGVPTKNLSYGDKRVLEIGIALASRPRLLLMDEPTSGLPTSETERIKKFIEKVSEKVTVVVIEHDMDVVLSLSDVIIVLQQGEIIAQGSPEEIKTNSKVQEAYLGGIE